MGPDFRIILAAVAISVVPLAGASAQGAGQGPVAQACAEDIGKLCAGKDHGKGEARACLESNKDKISAACKTALDTTGGGRQMQKK